MNVLGICSNTCNILATLFKHIFDENEFAPRAYTLIKGALYLQWRRGRGGAGVPGGFRVGFRLLQTPATNV